MNLLYITLGLFLLHHALVSESAATSSLQKVKVSLGRFFETAAQAPSLFREAIENNDWGTASRIFENANSETREECSKIFVKKFEGKSKVLNAFLKRLFKDPQGRHHWVWLIKPIMSQAKPSDLHDILRGVGDLIDDETLKMVASDVNIADKPSRFIDVILSAEDQEGVLDVGMQALHNNRKYSCLNLLIKGLHANNYVKLEATVVRRAFLMASIEGIKPWLESLYKHFAISHRIYAEALRKAYRHFFGRNDPTFKWLLAQADKDDLKKTLRVSRDKESGIYYRPLDREKLDYGEDFRAIISSALEQLKDKNVDRIPSAQQDRAEFVKKTFSGIPSLQSLGKEHAITDIIGSYLAGELEEIDDEE